jgi:hypothetical protein
MAIGICVVCDEFADESEFDWDLELCWDCAADREEEEEEEYNSDSKLLTAQLGLALIGGREMQEAERFNGKILNFARNYGMSQADLSKIVMEDD